MERYDYKSFGNAFSAEKVLRQIEEHEGLGWTLYYIRPTQFLILGSGGTAGLMAVMRRPRDQGNKASDDV